VEYQQHNSGQGLGIAGLILGILSILFAIIPCTAIVGVFLGGIGLMLSIFGVVLASKHNAQKGLVIAALVVSIIGVLIAGLWGVYFVKKAKENNVIENYGKFKKDLKKLHKLNIEYKDSLDKTDSVEFKLNKVNHDKEAVNK